MKKYFDQLDPKERRIFIVVGVMVFVVVQFIWVWPRFGDLRLANIRKTNAENRLATFRTEIARKPTYTRRISDLQGADPIEISESQALYVDRFYNDKARENKVTVTGNSHPNYRTNDYFIDQEVGISVQGAEKSIVDFLYSLGDGNSIMRVRAMSVRPDPSHQALYANMSLVASYQKKEPSRSKAPAPAAAADASSTAAKSSNPDTGKAKTTQATNKTGSENPKRP